jgi:hypothetical protein
MIERHADHALVSAIGNLGGKRTEFVLCRDCKAIVSEIKLAHQAAAPAITSGENQ